MDLLFIVICKNSKSLSVRMFGPCLNQTIFSVKFYLKEVSILSTYQILSTHTYINFTFTTALQRRFAVSNLIDGYTEALRVK